MRNLYNHINKLDALNIKNTLKGSKLQVFKNIDKIPNELLIKIYNLPNDYFNIS